MFVQMTITKTKNWVFASCAKSLARLVKVQALFAQAVTQQRLFTLFLTTNATLIALPKFQFLARVAASIALTTAKPARRRSTLVHLVMVTSF
jgi:hypothetical protein